ncbi:hypothetical protein [Paenibacillus paridis]|nr:hypothetical protein [Paenibacillus paridis]
MRESKILVTHGSVLCALPVVATAAFTYEQRVRVTHTYEIDLAKEGIA